MSATKKTKPKSNRGRKPFAPSPKDRREVETLAGVGLSVQQICKLVLNPKTGGPIDDVTLYKYFRRELEIGMIRADVAVVQSLFQQAVGRDAQYHTNGKLRREELKPSCAAAIFWTKVRKNLRWTERIEIATVPYDLTQLTDAELATFESLARKAAIARPDQAAIAGPDPERDQSTRH